MGLDHFPHKKEAAVPARARHTSGLLITIALGLLVPLAVMAQPAGQLRRIGMLRAGATSTDFERNLEAFRQALRNLGWIEGQNLAVEYRAAEDQVERLPELVANLLRLQVEVLVTAGGLDATYVANAATSTVPIVMVTSADPVRAGLLTSLARPGGNITGVAGLETEIIARRLELLNEAVPQVARIAVLVNSMNAPSPLRLREVQVAAQALGLQLHRRLQDRTGESGVFCVHSTEKSSVLFAPYGSSVAA
ncbi:MAG: ABC transporter substrate-binding protein [Candidatus Entotheonellia bacterium]